VYKGKVWCKDCDRLLDFEFKLRDDMPKVCSMCNSENVFYQQLDFGDDKDSSPVKTGDGGCGGYRR